MGWVSKNALTLRPRKFGHSMGWESKCMLTRDNGTPSCPLGEPWVTHIHMVGMHSQKWVDMGKIHASIWLPTQP